MEIRGLQKRFPGTLALDDVSFDIQRNTVHCIIGENGSGKSTMIKILTGAHERTGGEILFEGRLPSSPKTIREAMARGSRRCTRNSTWWTTSPSRRTSPSAGRSASRADQDESRLSMLVENLRSLDESIQLTDRVGDLSVAQRQVIEITRAISTNCKLLVMDEPTAALSEEEAKRMFAVIRKLEDRGSR